MRVADGTVTINPTHHQGGRQRTRISLLVYVEDLGRRRGLLEAAAAAVAHVVVVGRLEVAHPPPQSANTDASSPV
jgi:hypothetical protein